MSVKVRTTKRSLRERRVPQVLTIPVYCQLPGAPRSLYLEFDPNVTPEQLIQTVWELYQHELEGGRMYCPNFVRHPNVLDYTLQPALTGGMSDTLSPPFRATLPLRTQCSAPHAVVFAELQTTKLDSTALFHRHKVEREEMEDFELICRSVMISWYDAWFSSTTEGITEFLVAFREWEEMMLAELIANQQELMEQERQDRYLIRVDENTEAETEVRVNAEIEWSLFSMLISREQALEWASLLDHADRLRDLKYLEECTERFNAALPDWQQRTHRMYLEKQVIYDMSLVALNMSETKIEPPPPPPPIPTTFTLLVNVSLDGVDPVLEFETERLANCGDVISCIWDFINSDSINKVEWPSSFLRDYSLWYENEPLEHEMILFKLLDEEPYSVDFGPAPLFIARKAKWRQREEHLHLIEEQLQFQGKSRPQSSLC